MTGTGHLGTLLASKNDGPACKPDWHLSQISAILILERKAGIMCKKFTPDEWNQMDHTAKNDVIFQMQDRLDKLEQNYETLMEQVRLANQQRFGRQTEKLDDIVEQLSFFTTRKRITMGLLLNRPAGSRRNMP